MKKRALSLLVCAALMLCGCDSKPEEVSVPQVDNTRVNPIEESIPEWEYKELEDGGISLGRYNGSAAVVKIPSEIDGKPVKELGYSFYIRSENSVTLEIPASLEEIKSWSLDGDNLTEFVVAEDNKNYYSKDGMLFIKSDNFIIYEKDALYRCPKGKRGEVTVPEGTTAIDSYAFSGCDKITAVRLPESVEKIDDGAFNGCSALTSVNIPKAVTAIEGYTFMNCTSLETLDIPETVTDISQYPFYGTPFQDKIIEKDTFVVINGILIDGTAAKGDVTVPDNVKRIAYGAFSPYGYNIENTELKKVTIPDSVEEIAGSVFEDCTALEEVRLPNGLTELGWYLFRNCKSLKSIDIPNGVEDLGMDSFENCENLEQVNVPDSVVGVGYVGCFEGCDKVNITFKGNTYTAAEIDKFYEAVMENARAKREER